MRKKKSPFLIPRRNQKAKTGPRGKRGPRIKDGPALIFRRRKAKPAR